MRRWPDLEKNSAKSGFYFTFFLMMLTGHKCGSVQEIQGFAVFVWMVLYFGKEHKKNLTTQIFTSVC